MGFVTGSIRLFYLTQLRNDLEYKIMLISEAKMDMAKAVTDLIGVGTDLNPDSPIVKDMKARREKLEIMSKELDAKMVLYKNKLQAVEKEIGSAQAVINGGIKRSFSYGQNGG